jgi:hypothetical protein
MNNKEAGKSILVAQVLLALALVHAGVAQPGQAQPAPAEKPPQSPGETLIIGTTTLKLGMSKDSVIPALGMHYNILAWPMMPSSSKYSVNEDQSKLVGIVSFDGQGNLTAAEKTWMPEDRHYSDGEIGRALVALFASLVSKGKNACSIGTSQTPSILENGRQARIVGRDSTIECGGKRIRISTTTFDGEDSMAIGEEIGGYR